MRLESPFFSKAVARAKAVTQTFALYRFVTFSGSLSTSTLFLGFREAEAGLQSPLKFRLFCFYPSAARFLNVGSLRT